MPLRFILLALTLSLTACGPFPRDAMGSTERAERGLLVGASHDPPFVIVGVKGVSGPDVELIERFAGRHGYKVEWRVAGHEALMEALEEARLHAVIGGHSDDSPWTGRIAWSREVPTEVFVDGAHVRVNRRVALPPGESQWNMVIEDDLATHEGAR